MGVQKNRADCFFMYPFLEEKDFFIGSNTE